MFEMKSVYYDCVRFFVYCNNDFSIRCDNAAIISLFARECKEHLLDYKKCSPNWIIVRNASLRNFSGMISFCDVNGLEYEVM